MKIPFIVIFTKVDLVTQEDFHLLLENFKERLALSKVNKIPLTVKDPNDIDLFSRNLEESIIPMFQVFKK